MDNFRDEYGNIKANPHQKTSENPSIFNAGYFLLTAHAQHGMYNEAQWEEARRLVRGKWETQVDKELRTMENDPNPDFSLDEAIGIASICNLFYFEGTKKKLRPAKYWLRFYDVVPYLLLIKYPWMEWLGFLRASVSFHTLIACTLNFKKQFPYVELIKEGDTSGKLLAYVKCRGLRMDWTYDMCEKILAWRGTSFKKAFAFYFGYWDTESGMRMSYTDHPSNIKAREVWPEL